MGGSGMDINTEYNYGFFNLNGILYINYILLSEYYEMKVCVIKASEGERHQISLCMMETY